MVCFGVVASVVASVVCGMGSGVEGISVEAVRCCCQMCRVSFARNVRGTSAVLISMSGSRILAQGSGQDGNHRFGILARGVFLRMFRILVVLLSAFVVKTSLVYSQIAYRYGVFNQEGICPVVQMVAARNRTGYNNEQQANTHRNKGGKGFGNTAHQHVPAAEGHGMGGHKEQAEQPDAQEEDGVDQEIGPNALRADFRIDQHPGNDSRSTQTHQDQEEAF